MSPSTRAPQRRSPRRRAIAAGVFAGSVLLTAAACSAGGGTAPDTASSRTPSPSHSPRPSPAPAGVVSLQQATAVVTRYVRINNQANAVQGSDLARALRLNAEIEGNGLKAQSVAMYSEYKVWSSKAQADNRKPFYYTNPHLFIPASVPAGQQPFFFAVVHNSVQPKVPRLMVFVRRASDHTVWLAEATVDIGQTLPAVALDAQGYATVVAPDDSGLAFRPSLLPLSVNDNYVTGGKGDGARLAANKLTTGQRSYEAGWKNSLRPYGSAEVLAGQDPYQDVWALRTSTGGALVVASRAFTQHDFPLLPTGYINTPAHDPARAWVGAHSNRLDLDYLCLDAASIPRAGKAVALGEDCTLTHAVG